MNTKKDNVVNFFCPTHKFRPTHKAKDELLKNLYNEHGKALRTFLFSRVNALEELEDIIQEVFSRLAKIDNLQEKLSYGTRSSRAFLFTSANNYLVDLERRKLLERGYVSDKSLQNNNMLVEATPEAIVQAEEELALIKESIRKLRPVWRKAFVLSRFEHLSYQQIAGQMEISIKTVEKYITCALIEIRNDRAKSYVQKKQKAKGKDSE